MPREALDLTEGASLLVDFDDDKEELEAVTITVEGLPAGFKMYRLRSDCYLVPWQDKRGTWLLKLNGPKLKKRHQAMLAELKPA